MLTYNGRFWSHLQRLISIFLIAILLLPLSACAALFNGASQGIPFGSNPPGAEVYVDGELMGITPIEVKLKRQRNHEVLVKLGDLERSFTIERTVSIAGGIGLALDVLPGGVLTVVGISNDCTGDWDDLCKGLKTIVIGTGLALVAIPLAIDLATGDYYSLTPGEVFVDFETSETEQ